MTILLVSLLLLAYYGGNAQGQQQCEFTMQIWEAGEGCVLDPDSTTTLAADGACNVDLATEGPGTHIAQCDEESGGIRFLASSCISDDCSQVIDSSTCDSNRFETAFLYSAVGQAIPINECQTLTRASPASAVSFIISGSCRACLGEESDSPSDVPSSTPSSVPLADRSISDGPSQSPSVATDVEDVTPSSLPSVQPEVTVSPTSVPTPGTSTTSTDGSVPLACETAVATDRCVDLMPTVDESEECECYTFCGNLFLGCAGYQTVAQDFPFLVPDDCPSFNEVSLIALIIHVCSLLRAERFTRPPSIVSDFFWHFVNS